jgi:2-aminobenzoate-CoA ligase
MSAHIDRFVIDRLPPASRQPQMLRDLPELQFADQLNLVQELLDRETRSSSQP